MSSPTSETVTILMDPLWRRWYRRLKIRGFDPGFLMRRVRRLRRSGSPLPPQIVVELMSWCGDKSVWDLDFSSRYRTLSVSDIEAVIRFADERRSKFLQAIIARKKHVYATFLNRRSLASLRVLTTTEPWQDEMVKEAINAAERKARESQNPHPPYWMLSHAYRDGWRKRKPDDYEGESLQLKGRSLVRNAKKAQSKSEWARQGFRIREGEQPHGHVEGRGGPFQKTWPVYREDQVVGLTKRDIPTKVVPILAALWTISKKARAAYGRGRYFRTRLNQLSAQCFEEWERLNRLKKQALHHLLANGTLTVREYFVLRSGNWIEVLTGEGYIFHRPCPPPRDTERRFTEVKEAKPAGRGPSLKNAVHTMNEFLADKPDLPIYEWPGMERKG